MTPRGIRNNNPGNIRKSGIAWQGKIVGPDPDFETFNTPHNGIRALASNLIAYQDRYGLKTIRGIINRWAPPVENNTSAYVTVVAKAVGVDQDAPVNLHSLGIMRPLVVAIINRENGTPPPGGWYPSALIGAAIGDALGIVPKVEPVPPAVQPRNQMDPISIFLPIIAQLIPQIAKVIGGGERAQANVAIAQTVLDTVVKATGSANEQEAVSKMQSDPAMLKAATEAVVTEPTIMGILEIGGGIKAAREADAAAVRADKPFWYSPAFWISVLLLVMPFMLLADVFYVHPAAYDGNLRTQIVTGVLAIVMIVGGYFLGSSQGSQKKDDLLAQKGNV